MVSDKLVKQLMLRHTYY